MNIKHKSPHKPQTLYEKLWRRHLVSQEKNGPAILYIDIHYLHEVTSPQAFVNLRKKKLKVRRPDLTFASCDHTISTLHPEEFPNIFSRIQVETLIANCRDFGITLFGPNSPYQGIIHVIGPELGISQPGQTIVCGDSHTSTHGALGALAFGIGTSEVEEVLACQCLPFFPLKTMVVKIEGNLGKGVTSKDLILALIRKIGLKGAQGFALEYAGKTVKEMSLEERMTLCNMSIEAGAKVSLIAPDEKTFDYLKGKKFAPSGKKWQEAVKYWQSFQSDEGAKYDKEVFFSAEKIEPLVTWGTDPSTAITLSEKIPSPKEAKSKEEREKIKRALSYMGLKPKMKLEGFPIDYVFLGSCTNGRLSDLRAAAKIIKNKKIKKRVIAFVVPGSQQVKKAAEKEGLDKIFQAAGFSWRSPGCSACLALNEDKIPPGKYCFSTSNRNFEGRQGPGARTFLGSPLMAAAAALEGKIVDVRNYL